jgi:hypothetical protein
MATVDSPTAGYLSAQVDQTQQALRVTPRPIEFNGPSGSLLGGHYAQTAVTTAIAPNASVILANFRFTDTARSAIIFRVAVNVVTVTAITAQVLNPLRLFVARSYSVDDTTNGTPLTLTGNNGKRRANMATCSATMRLGANAAGMTGGTSTVDTQPIGSAAPPQSLIAVGSNMPTTDLYKWDKSSGDYPLTLTAFEGLQVLWGTTTLATGTVIVSTVIEWAEVASF